MSRDSKASPSFTHLCIIAHLFGTVRYVFQMSESERVKFCGGHRNTESRKINFFKFIFHSATFDQQSTSDNEDGQTQTQQERSAMFTIWNLIADLIESNDQKENQQQITDFYGKAATTFPRLACLMQLYFNAAKIMDELNDTILFAEGDHNDLSVNENFLVRAQNLIKRDYYKYDKSYIPCDEICLASSDPMIIVGKDAVIAAWKWYEYHLNIATKLFTFDPHAVSTSIQIPSSISPRQKNLKQLIMLFDFNVFPVSAITDKHPISGHTYVVHQ